MQGGCYEAVLDIRASSERSLTRSEHLHTRPATTQRSSRMRFACVALWIRSATGPARWISRRRFHMARRLLPNRAWAGYMILDHVVSQTRMPRRCCRRVKSPNIAGCVVIAAWYSVRGKAIFLHSHKSGISWRKAGIMAGFSFHGAPLEWPRPPPLNPPNAPSCAHC